MEAPRPTRSAYHEVTGELPSAAPSQAFG